MKPKYIDVNSLVVAYSGHTPDDDFTAGVNYVLDLLEKKQGEDVRPAVRGRWVQHQNSTEHMVCSACNRTWHNLWCPNVMFDYCPNCGADMRNA